MPAKTAFFSQRPCPDASYLLLDRSVFTHPATDHYSLILPEWRLGAESATARVGVTPVTPPRKQLNGKDFHLGRDTGAVAAFSHSSGTFLFPSGVFLSPATAAEHKNQQKRQLQQKFKSPGFPTLLPTRSQKNTHLKRQMPCTGVAAPTLPARTATPAQLVPTTHLKWLRRHCHPSASTLCSQ